MWYLLKVTVSFPIHWGITWPLSLGETIEKEEKEAEEEEGAGRREVFCFLWNTKKKKKQSYCFYPNEKCSFGKRQGRSHFIPGLS